MGKDRREGESGERREFKELEGSVWRTQRLRAGYCSKRLVGCTQEAEPLQGSAVQDFSST